MFKLITCLCLMAFISALVLCDEPVVKPEAPKEPTYQKGPFENSEIVTLEGTVKNVVPPHAGKGPQEVYFTLATANDFVKVMLARPVVLKLKGLDIKEDTKVSLTGWQITDKSGMPTYVQTAEITVDGKVTQLLSPKGQKTWTQFDITPLTTLEGTVKDLVAPQPEKPAVEAPKPAGDAPKTEGDAPKPAAEVVKTRPVRVEIVSFTLVTDKEPVKITVGPYRLLAELGLTLTEGAKVTVSGWAFPEQFMAKEITLDGKTFIIRGTDGKMARIARPNEVIKPKPEKPKETPKEQPKEQPK